jgi:hypothetical protein
VKNEFVIKFLGKIPSKVHKILRKDLLCAKKTNLLQHSWEKFLQKGFSCEKMNLVQHSWEIMNLSQHSWENLVKKGFFL